MGETYSVTAVLSAIDKNFSSVMQKAASQTASFSDKVKSTMTGVGTAMGITGTAITAMGVKSVESFGKFEQEINKAAVIAGGSSKDIKGLSDEAAKLGSTLPISAQDAAAAMTEMARNGASVKDLKNDFPPIARAAASAGEDLSNTATVVQQSMNLWGGGMKNATKYSAILTETANKSNATIGDMQQVLADVGGTATNMGMSLSDVSTAAGIMTNSGIPAAQAAQELNHALLAMEAPSNVARKEMEALGLKFSDANGKAKPLPTILREVAKATDGMGDAQKAAALKAMFGTAGMNAMMPLLKSVNGQAKSGNTDWNTFAAALDKAGGSYQKASKYLQGSTNQMQKNVGSQIDQLKDSFTSLSISANQSSSKGIQQFLIKVQDLVGHLTTSNDKLSVFVRNMIALAPVIGPVVAVIGGLLIVTAKVASAVGTLAKGFLAVGKGVIGLVSKLIGVATGNTAVGATSAGAATGEKAVGESAEKSAGQLIAMGLAVLEIGAGIALALGGLALLVLSITQLAKQGMNGVIALATFGATVAVLAGVFAVLGPVLTASAVGLLAFSVAIISAGAGVALFGAGMLAMGAGLALAGQGVTALVNAFILLGNNISLIIPIMSSIGAGFSALLTGMLNAVITNIPLIGQTFIALGQTILNVISTLSLQIIQTVMNLLLLLVNTIVTYTPIFTAKIAQLIISMLNTITTYLPRIILAGTNLIVALLNGIALAMPRIITAAVNVIVAFINGIANNLGRIINAGINLLAKFIMGIVNAIPRLASVAVQAVMKFVYGVGSALGQVLGSGQRLINMFVRGVIDGFGKSQSSGKGNANKVDSGIRSVSLLDVGKFLIQGFINGMGSMGSDIWNAAVGIANKAKNAIKSALGIHSPSRVMKDEVGKWIPAGIAVGMNKNVDWITSAAKNMVKAATISIPSPNFEDFRNGFNRIQSLSSSAFSGSVNGSMTLNASTLDQQNNALLRRIADKDTNLYMDSDTLVGTTSDKFNGQLGATSNNDERWGW
ncbi:phage tail tape measure protein, TP901 family [Pediococcus acidilactici 7_4]|uniref:phage tail tape measure protein n=1 Tax=Pediococcus acidilactici TaxID=1254 RepID=UPI0001BEDEAE|nr:phage tail tape measure protein [Pediococcus acidilactici]EFA25785.1 phage tail tape measure protein, TP901 family [Pediococcus acidilactici 7_4]